MFLLQRCSSFLLFPRRCSAMADWSGLPRDLLLQIGKRLDSHFDVLHFRAVCSTWRASVPLNLGHRLALCLPLPWFPPLWEAKEAIGWFLVKSTTCLFKFPADPSHTAPRFWLASLGEDRFGKKHLRLPFSWHELRSEIESPIVSNLDISNLHVQELDSDYYTMRLSTIQVQEMDSEMGVIMRTAYLNGDDDDNQFTLLVEDRDLGPLILFKSVDEKGTKIKMEDKEVCCWDFTQFKGKFYGIDFGGRTISIEPSSGASFGVVNSSSISGHLVESCGNLLLVNMIPNRRNPVECRVFQLDEVRKEWVPLVSLGGGILFLGGRHKFSAPAIPGIEGNCVVFVSDCIDSDAFVFDLSRKMTVPLIRRPDLYQLLIPPNTSAGFDENLG